MKTSLLTFLSFIMMSSTADLSAQASSFERDLAQLIQQRDKAIEAAVAPLNEKFKTAAEQMLRRATQAGDIQAAQKIIDAIEANEAGSASGGERVKDSRKDISGTSWTAEDPASLRPGLTESLIFGPEKVEPSGLFYEVPSSRTVTIVFTRGDRQLLNLTNGGTRLELEFGGKTYSYKIDP